MKLPFTIYDLRFTICKKSAESPAFNRQSSIVNRKSQSGVALVLTLILLSVALVMTLAFLAISGREQGSVTTQTDTATTRLATDAGLAAAEAQIAANILSTTNPYGFGLIVSTNYAPYQPKQFATVQPFLQALANLQSSPRPPVAILQNGTNDFRFYLDLNRNGTNDPNGWVLDSGTNNFVFEVGDPEWIGVLERPDLPYGPNNPFIARYAFIALPVGNSLDLNAIHNQAFDKVTGNRAVNPPPAGVGDAYLRNQGVGSWELNLPAFLADLNTNQWDSSSASGGSYQYNQVNALPNSGAAFDDARALLAFRYANNYTSLLPVGGVNGLFTNSTISFPPFQNDIDAYSDGPLMTTAAGINDGQDITLPWAGADNTNHFFDLPSDLFDPIRTQVGATAGQIGAGNYFSNHLAAAGAARSTYDRYTFYRMLSQLGTDTTPDSGKMNLNYDNLDPGFNGVLNTNGTASATNFVPWTPLNFFYNAADRMLRAYTAQWAVSYVLVTNNGVASLVPINNPNFVATFNVTNAFGVEGIPVLVSNRFVYTPAVQRVLQLAANLYDASTANYFPSVFRPLFSRDVDSLGVAGMGTNLYVSGYEAVTNVFGPGDARLSQPVDATALTMMSGSVINLATNVYGVPWIIGAKKGFPNFNEFVQENAVGITRRLQLTRDLNYETNNYPKTRITGTNQMYILNLNSSVGLDFWNSYNSNFLDNVTVFYRVITWMSITNDDPGFDGNPSGVMQPMGFVFSNAYTNTYWSGTSPWSPAVQYGGSGQPNPYSFITPLYSSAYTVLTNSVYRTSYATGGTLPLGFTGPCLIPTNHFYDLSMPVLFETSTPGFPLPHFGLLTTNRLQVFILDGANNNYHVIDYAHFEQNSSRDLNAEIFNDDAGVAIGSGLNVGIWNTNIDPNTQVPYGIENQILISKGKSGTGFADQAQGAPAAEDGTWRPDAEALQYGSTIQAQQAYFQAFFQPYGAIAHISDYYGQASASNTEASVQAPYAPTRYGVGYTVLQANDPLVHYLASDLAPSFPAGLLDLPTQFNNFYTNELTSLNLGSLNYSYQPWGGNPVWVTTLVPDPNGYNLAERDPLVSQSDYWNFPTNKFPTTGWMGRVHRGTPWQTVYLKSPGININKTWAPWTGNPNPYDAGNSAPATDRLLFDLFTTAFNDNATRGTLSVNQSADQYDPVANSTAGLAAWSALFSGIVVPTNSVSGYVVINPAGPAGSSSPLGGLVADINATRAALVNADGLAGDFEHAGDILATPSLTVSNQWILQNNSDPVNGISDAMYEWLPQQAMSLLRVGAPRYVIYSYGQALKPAPNGIYQSGATLANGQPAFGMVTNYQVMSEMATRAVVRLDTVRTNASGAIIVTPPRAVIESFNILPPD